MNEHEGWAAGLLERYLRETFGLNAHWQAGADPPDFVFSVNAEKWAVEETQLHQYIQSREKPESRLAVDAPLTKMCERIKRNAQPSSHRDYVISAFGPIEDKKLKDVEQEAIAHINSGSLEAKKISDTVTVTVYPRPARVEYIVGLDAKVAGADGKTVSADIKANLEFALDRILEAKLPRLGNLAGFNRRVLLITKQYLFAEVGDVKNHLAGKVPRENCDTVLMMLEDGAVHWVADPGKLFSPA